MTFKHIADIVARMGENGDTPLGQRSGRASVIEQATSRLRHRLTITGSSEAYIRASIGFAWTQADIAFGITESPIERDAAVSLIFADYSAIQGSPSPAMIVAPGERMPDAAVFIVPQFKIAQYRLDFVVFARVKGLTRGLAVECDGRDFHHTEIDRRRDQDLRRLGIETIRFTGSQINQDAMYVGEGVSAILTVWGSE